MDGQSTSPRAFRIETVRGEPIIAGERKLIPVARVISFGKARATIGADGTSGWGGGFVRVRPLAVLEVTPDGERRIALQGESAEAIRGMFSAAVAIALFFSAIRRMVRWKRSDSPAR